MFLDGELSSFDSAMNTVSLNAYRCDCYSRWGINSELWKSEHDQEQLFGVWIREGNV